MNWQEIYKHLADKNFDVFSPGRHEGDCKTSYIVLKNNGAKVILSRNIQEYELLLYHPENKYSSFEDYIMSVRKSMNKLYPKVKLIEDQQSHYLDADNKAFMTSLIYQTQKIEMVNRV